MGFELQAAPALPCRVHGPSPPTGHDMFGHAMPLLLQLTSHRHEPAQSIDGHALAPEQLMSHAAGPQLTLPHAIALRQSILQWVAAAQSMSPQLPVSHRMEQSKPGGHFTWPQTWLESHWTSQVLPLRLQDVHGGGHPLEVSTQ